MTTTIRFLLGAVPLALLAILGVPSHTASPVHDISACVAPAVGFFDVCAELDTSRIDDLREGRSSDTVKA